MKKLRKTIYLKIARMLGRRKDGMNVPAIIAENTMVTGDIASTGILHVDGTVEGDVSCEELIIGVKGMVTGTVKAQNLHLYGSLKGRAFVDNLFMAHSARLFGDASHNTIAIEPGAYIDGCCIKNKPSLTLVNEKPEKQDKSEKTEKVEKTDKVEKADKPEKTVKTERSSRLKAVK